MSWTLRTTAGPVSLAPEDGYVLPHEHIIFDLRRRWHGEGACDDLDEPGKEVTLPNLDALRHHPQATARENLVFTDWYLAAKELREARQTGCTLVADLTTAGLSPMPSLVHRAAQQAGLHAIVPVGRYMASTLDAAERERPAEEVAERWLSQITEGIDGCIPGVIGEIGVGPDLAEAEHRSLQAAAITQQRTGLAVNVHIEPLSGVLKPALDAMEKAGADMTRVIVSHMDFRISHQDIGEVLRRGSYAEFDLFGRAPLFRFGGRYSDDDESRVAALIDLAEHGHLDQLLVSHDICMRHCLKRYGGYGYAHLSRHIFPVLEKALGADALTTLTRRNPLRALASPS